MEGVPRVPMLAPELRIPDPLPDQFASKIKQYISYHYQDDPDKFDDAFTELVSMRISISRCIPDIETLCVMKRYYAQLVMMKKRFPMEQNDPIAIPFSWTDRTSDIPSSLVFEDINFELCSILYNIGAMHAQFAAVETRSDLDSIKNAFMHFQYAAWPLQQLRDKMNAAKFGANDFQISILTFYLNVLLAQAQECMLEKSMIDHRKPTVIAKVAMHLAALYQQCHEHLDNSDLADHISSSKFKQWSRLCAVKSELYRAVSNFYMGVYAEDEKNFGLRLAYMAAALDQIKKASKLAEKEKQESLKQSVAFASDVIVQKEANARKENDFIYHERVPKPDDLPKVDGVVMVKPIGFDSCDRSISGEDLFAALLPSNVIKAISMYSEEKAKFKRKIDSKIEQRDSHLIEYLNTLQLYKINFDQTSEHLRLPEELLRSSAAFVAQPDAFPELLDKFDKVAKFSADAEIKLGGLKTRLKAITHPSLINDEGYKAIAAKLEELTSHHVKARTNNTELQRAVATHSGNLKLLAMPLTELAREVCGEPINITNTEEGIQLRKLLDKVDEMQKQRIKLHSDFQSDLENDDITQKALVERDLDAQKLFDAELKKHDKLVDLIELNLSAQDNILQALTEANANFASLRKQIDQATERRNQQALALVTAFEVYEDVKSKTEKALNFYSQLFTIIGTLEKTIANMEEVFAKLKSEDDEKKKRAEEEIASKMMQASLQEDFPNLPTDLSTPSLSTANVPSPISTPENSSSGRPRRPRLGDYMDFYRNKMGNNNQRPITHPATQSQEVRLPEPAISMQSNGNFVPVSSIPPQMPNQIVGPNFSTPNQLPTHAPTIQQNLPQQIQPTSNTAAPIGHPNAYHQGQAVQPHPTSIPNPHMNVTYSMQTPQMSVPISMANPSHYGHMPQENTGQPQQQFPMSSGVQPHIHNTSMQPGNVLGGVQQGHFPAPSQLQSQTPAVHSTQAYHAFSSMPTGQNQQIQSGYPTQQMQQPGHPTQQMQPGHPTQQIQSGHPTQQMQPGYPTQQMQSGHPTQQMQHQLAALPQHSSTSSGHAPSAIFGQQFQQPIQQQQPTYMQPTSQHPQQIHSSMPQAITGSVLPQAPTQAHAFDPKNVIASQQSMSSNWAQHASMASMSSVSAANTMVAPSKSPINMPSVHPQNNMPRPQTPTSNPSIQSQSISPWHRNIPTSTYNTANNPHPQQSHPQFQQFQRDAATPASPFQPIQPAPAQTAVHFNPIQEANPPISASLMQHIPNPPVQQIPSQMHPSQNAPNLTNQNVVVKNSNLDLLSELFDDQLSATPVLAPSPVVTKQHNVGSTPPSDEKAANFQHLYSNNSLNAIPPQQPAMPQFFNTSVEKEQKLERNHYTPSLPTSSPRPAATVLPIVQPSPAHSNPSVSVKNPETNTSCLCITNVSSVSHAGEHSQQQVVLKPGPENPTSSKKISSLLDPNTFEIGESDEIKLQKRQLREQFKNFGTAAQLPKLNENDPLNQLDPKFWLEKHQ